ncbi:MAG TPA: FMN reductase [Micromonosporaceae bacterium]|nr:FMN reductase [Micromonosporaceae bacterium]
MTTPASGRKLVVVSAGLSQPSSTRLLADQLAGAVVDALDQPAQVRTVELREHAHDIVNNLLTGFPSEPLREVVEAVAGADGIIAVTPVFNASYSGLFKSFFDVLDEGVLADRPVLAAATGGTARHSLALEHALRPMFTYLRAVVVPTAVFAASEDWAGGTVDGGLAGGGLAGGGLRRRIERAAGELAREIGRREPASPPDPFALTASFDELLG